MAELDWRKYTGPGWKFESALIDLEIYRLITAFGASRTFVDNASAEGANAGAWEMLKNFECVEIPRILVSVAAMCRSNLDAGIGAGEESDRPVGLIDSDNDHPPEEWQDLLFRNACNKILHADNINFDVDDTRLGMRGPLNAKLYLYGTHRKKHWKALLDVSEFVMAATYTS